MKNYLYTTLLLFLAFSLNAQQIEVPEQQYSLVTKRTASWCTHCGNWGWELFENLLQDNSTKALIVAAHYSGGLANPTASAITGNFGSFGQPIFYLNNDNQSVSSGNIDDKRIQIKESINSNFSQSPTAQTGMLLGINDGQLDVFTKTRFFENAEGDYHLGIYLIQKNITHSQTGQGSNAQHKNVLYKAVTSETFGDLIADGTISAGSEYAFQTSLTLGDNDDLLNLMVATILWKYDGDKYQFVNVNFSDDFVDGLVETDEVALGVADFSVSPNPTTDQAIVTLNLENNLDQAEITLFDIQGRKLATLFNGQIPAGNNQFTVNKSQVQQAGIYFIQLRADQKVVVQKVSFR